jgi:hypothetical protein
LGPAFQKVHIARFPNLALPGLQTNLGAFAVEHILERAAPATFPSRSSSRIRAPAACTS